MIEKLTTLSSDNLSRTRRTRRMTMMTRVMTAAEKMYASFSYLRLRPSAAPHPMATAQAAYDKQVPN